MFVGTIQVARVGEEELDNVFVDRVGGRNVVWYLSLGCALPARGTSRGYRSKGRLCTRVIMMLIGC